MINGWALYNASQKPIFNTSVEYNTVTFYYLQDNLKAKKEVSDKWSDKLTKRQIEILYHIQNNNKISREELSEKIGINPSAIQQHINTLKELEILKRIGPDRGGYWEVADTD